MPKQTRKKRTGGVPARVVPKAPPAKPAKKVKFKAAAPPRALHTVVRMRCPLCNMITDIEDHVTQGKIIPGFINVKPEFRIYDQSFGGRLPAPHGTKPGHKSKEALGIMEYKDITDPSSDQYKNVVDVIRVRIGNINDSLLAPQVEERMAVKRKPRKKKTA